MTCPYIVTSKEGTSYCSLAAEQGPGWQERKKVKLEPSGTPYLVAHTLGAGINYDVGCYRGRDAKGDDLWYFHNTEILAQYIVYIQPIEPPVGEDQ